MTLMLESDGAPSLPLDDGTESVVRRAPFATNPFVGARGQRAQQRILEAALQVFGDVGYHECGVKRITELSGCSRASFYQYFSSKEDLFRHLAGRVARLLADSTDALGPITADRAGWESLHGWLVRYSAIYDPHEPVFTTFQTAATSDETVASGAARVAVRTFSGIRSQISGSELTSRLLDGVVRTVLDSVARVNRVASLLEGASLGGGAAARDRVDAAMADVIHRTLFGTDAAVNVHAPPVPAAPEPAGPVAVPDVPDVPAVADELAGDSSLGPGALRTRALLIETGHKVFAEKGYYATRVADVVAAAGVSHGVFYRYFANKTQLFRILAERASERLRLTLAEIPPIAGRAGDGPGDDAATLRGWLRRYATTSTEEAAITAMWSEAMSRDARLGAVSAAAIESFRAICARFLEPRGFGDVEAEAIVLLVVIDAMTATRAATPGRVETIAQVVERGLLTPPRP
jgi:AcrR family transcriptional regulator